MNATRTTVSIRELASTSGQKFGIAAQLLPARTTFQRTAPDCVRSVAPSNELIVSAIVTSARQGSSYGRAIVDWEQFRHQCGPFTMMSLAHSLSRSNGALFVEFVVGEQMGTTLISHDAALFIEEMLCETALRIDQAFFGDAAELITRYSPSLVTLEFSDAALPVRSTEVLNIVEACKDAGAWVSLAPPVHCEKDVAWLIERGIELVERSESIAAVPVFNYCPAGTLTDSRFCLYG